MINPGTHIKSWLEANHQSQAQLATAMNYKEPFISKLINGQAHISPKVAIRLEAATRIPAKTWIDYEIERALVRARMEAIQ